MLAQRYVSDFVKLWHKQTNEHANFSGTAQYNQCMISADSVLGDNKRMSSDESNELLFRCALRDASALHKLYKVSAPRMYSMALKLIRNTDLAEDILQETYIKIWKNAESFRPEKSSAGTWMMTILRNTALDKMRAIKRDPVYQGEQNESFDVSDFNRTPSDDTDHKEKLRRLLKCMSRLDIEQREAVLLSFYHGYSHSELSNKLKKPLGTVKGWIRRGLERLRECLKVNVES